MTHKHYNVLNVPRSKYGTSNDDVVELDFIFRLCPFLRSKRIIWCQALVKANLDVCTWITSLPLKTRKHNASGLNVRIWKSRTEALLVDRYNASVQYNFESDNRQRWWHYVNWKASNIIKCRQHSFCWHPLILAFIGGNYFMVSIIEKQ